MGDRPEKKTVEGEGFALKDKKGNDRAVLSMLEDGPYLWLWDAEGESRAELALGFNGPLLTLSDAQGKKSAQIGLNQEGLYLYFWDGRRQLETAVTLRADSGGFVLCDSGGRVLLSLPGSPAKSSATD